MRAIFFLLCMCWAVHHISCSSLKRKLSSRKQGFLTEIQEKNSKRGGFYNGCPEDNDFWTQGQISSPFWPQNYHNNESCYYYINAEQGAVVKIVFTHFDLELCCDYITIYDGAASGKSRVIAQLGGQGGATQPQSAYYSTTNQMLVTFMSNPTVTKSGFQFTYSSVTTARPCNRDISISINGMDSVGSQSNFVQQLRFLAQNLVASWDVGLDKVRVGMNLIVDDDYAVVWKYNDFKTTDQVQFAILGMTDDVPNVLANNNSDFA
uniref:CUB domain-containing protein n=1 Tax=Plectus sambesii TaxID=2011161 RepID=A0A914WU97_9BILA